MKDSESYRAANTVAIVVTCSDEAYFFITHYKLKEVAKKPFSFYESKDKSLRLIISGNSYLQCAVATAHLANHVPHAKTHFLHIGMAHTNSELPGSVFQIHKIYDKDTDSYFYPNTTGSKGRLLRSTKIQQDGDLDGLNDTTGAAFFQTASLYATEAYIWVYKIIVADRLSQQKDATSTIIELYARNRLTIQQIINDISHHTFQQKWHHAEDDIKASLRFSAYQSYELRDYIGRFKAHHPDLDPKTLLPGCRSAHDLLAKFKAILEDENEYAY